MKHSKWLSALSVIPALVFMVVWQVFFSHLNLYLGVSVMLVLCMLPFLVSFETKEVTAQEIALTATLIALAVVSRAAFYFLPSVKPIAAVVIVAAVCLGAQRGFIIGAFAAFISNFLFGQGTWTLFQMAALGLVGFVAGVIYAKIKPNRLNLALIGFLLAFALYGAVVDVSTILFMYGNKVTPAAVLSVYASGAPVSLVFGISTAVFLFVFGEIFIKKLNRIHTKFHLYKD